MAPSVHRSTVTEGQAVVLYSPGFGGTRDSGTILVEQLVSRGYIVATIDHTHDATVVEFPDGRVETRAIPETPGAIEQAVAVRVADTRFVLNTLTALNAGANPDAEHRNLPAGLRGAMRMSSLGMFGHSLGGATAAAAMLEDQRIAAGVNLDGSLVGPVVDAGLDRPFLAGRGPGPRAGHRRVVGDVLGEPAGLATATCN